jgi:hypothetical protein
MSSAKDKKKLSLLLLAKNLLLKKLLRRLCTRPSFHIENGIDP